jgi:metallo-beta-lactamase family protein
LRRDAARLGPDPRRDAGWYNRKVRRRGEPFAQPLYSEEEAIGSLRHFVGIDYGAPLSLGPGLRFELRDAGHVLGSAMVILDHENGRRTRLCFTGDLGRRSMPLLRDPSPVEDVNVLIMESTYGDRSHPAVSSMRTTLAEVVNRTVARRQDLIPALASSAPRPWSTFCTVCSSARDPPVDLASTAR